MFSAIRTRLTPKSLRTQLTLWYLVTLAIALAAFAAFVFVVRARTLSREADADLEIRAHRIAAVLRPSLLSLDVAGALSGDARLIAEPLLVREATGSIVFRSRAFPALDRAGETALGLAARENEGPIMLRGRDGTKFRVATIAAERPGAPPFVLQAAASNAPVDHLLRQLAFALIVFFVLVLAAMSYGGGFIAGRALRPVDAIVSQVRAIQASRLGDRLDIHTGSEELDRLVDTLNGMLDRIEGSMRSARRFAADASHELQTPIAAMRAAVETCLRRSDPIEDGELAADLLVDIDRLSALVRDLRLLALADAGHLLDRVQTVDLSALAAECCDMARAIAEPKQITVDAAIEGRLVVRGSELHLRRAVLNLAQNAVQYSPAASTVHVSLARVDDEAALALVDEGCGIGPADLPHIFERFYRADPARARETGGTGLGLAIADQIVRGHGGRIDVVSALDEGSTFILRLPIAPVFDAPASRSSARADD